MSLKTDIIFVRALRSNDELMEQLPAGDVYNTTIAMPEQDAENAPLPYIIVTYDGMQNEGFTKDNSYEGDTDHVQISIEVTAENREQLGDLMQAVRTTVVSFFDGYTPPADPKAEDLTQLIPEHYTLSASAVGYDPDKPCYYQTLNYNCDTNP